MSPTLTIPLIDGTRLFVPDSLSLIGCYVLHEQQNWFEDEIKFVRRLLRPAQQAIDIRANYGVYPLCSATSRRAHRPRLGFRAGIGRGRPVGPGHCRQRLYASHA